MLKQVVIISTIILILIMVAIGIGCGASSEKSDREIIVGNKNFAEQYIVGQLMKQLLEEREFTVELKSGRSSICLREGIEFGDIDIYAEYTGTAWMVPLAHEYKPGMDNNEIYRLVKEEDEDNGLIWLNPIWNNNTYALASWPEFAQEHSLKTLSDLALLYKKMWGGSKLLLALNFLHALMGCLPSRITTTSELLNPVC